MVKPKDKAVASGAAAAASKVQQRNPTKQQGNGDDDAEALRSEVAHFAAKLGLGGSTLTATAPGADDAFSDFAPSKAQRKLGEDTKFGASANRDRGAKNKVPGAGQQAAALQGVPPLAAGQRAGKQQPASKHNRKDVDGKVPDGLKDRPQQQQRDAQAQAQAGAASKREWNFGVGPRPGASRGHSLLGKDTHGIWYQAAAALPSLATPSSAPISTDEVDALRRQGEALLEAEAAAMDAALQRRSPADYRWMQQVKTAGTTADRVAAITLQVQESAVAGLRGLDMLLSWVSRSKGGRDVVRQAIDALRELFVTALLPDRRLRTLEQQPLAALPQGVEGARHLLWWALEEQIKVRYGLFLSALEECSRDNLEFVKDKAIKCMSELLTKKPEGEARLLSALVNKLGDPSRKLASKTAFLLMQLLLTHPLMKPIVAREVERFMFRPGLQDRARYYAVVFLNQLPLSHKEAEGGPALARKLVDIYFTLFRMLVEGKIGLAAEARKAQEERYRKERAAYLRMKQKAEAAAAAASASGPRGAKGAALAGLKDRTGKALKKPKKPTLATPEEMDARLLSALITGVRRALPFVPSEEADGLMEEHAQQLYRLVHTAPLPVAVQALLLMWQLLSARDAVGSRFYRTLYACLLNPLLPVSPKAAMLLSLTFKVMKADVSAKRVAAFAKRLLQTAVVGPPAYAAGVLLLVSEVLKAQPSLWAGILQPEDGGFGGHTANGTHGGPGSDDDGNELFTDAKTASDEEADASDDESDDGDADERLPHARASHKAVHAANGHPPTAHTEGASRAWPPAGYYDADKRDPEFALAERAGWWELGALAAHSHPSVAAFARTLLAGQHVLYAGDPLVDHAPTTFLEKFIAKKPKAKLKGASLMQPVAAAATATAAAEGGARPAAGPGVGSEAFAALAESQIQPDEVFFHRFYTLQSVRARREAAKRAKQAAKGSKGGDGSGDGSDDEEGPMSSDEEAGAAADDFMDKEEGGVDDALGDPDAGYDYAALMGLMQEDAAVGDRADGGSDDETDPGSSDPVSEGDEEGDTGGKEGGSEGEEEEEEEEEDGARDGEGKDRTEAELSAAADVSDLEDSGDDEEGEFVMAEAAHLARRNAGCKKRERSGTKAAPADDTEPGDEEIDDLGTGILDLPSPSESDSESDSSGSDGEHGGGRRRSRLQARIFDFSDDEQAAGAEEGGGSGDEMAASDPEASEPDEDLEELLLEGSDGEGDDGDGGGQASAEDGEEEEQEDAAGSHQGGRRQGARSSKRDHATFASADDYAGLLDELNKKVKTAGGTEQGEGPAEAQARQRRGSTQRRPRQRKGPGKLRA